MHLELFRPQLELFWPQYSNMVSVLWYTVCTQLTRIEVFSFFFWLGVVFLVGGLWFRVSSIDNCCFVFHKMSLRISRMRCTVCGSHYTITIELIYTCVLNKDVIIINHRRNHSVCVLRDPYVWVTCIVLWQKPDKKKTARGITLKVAVLSKTTFNLTNKITKKGCY